VGFVFFALNETISGMSNMSSIMNGSNHRRTFVINFDSNIYSASAVKRAAYELSNSTNVEIKLIEDRTIRVVISMNNLNVTDSEKFIRDFRDLVSDHQIRLDVEEDYRVIRQIIVAQAFQPCDNLKEIIDTLKMKKNYKFLPFRFQRKGSCVLLANDVAIFILLMRLHLRNLSTENWIPGATIIII